jgi:hypothetical protein
MMIASAHPGFDALIKATRTNPLLLGFAVQAIGEFSRAVLRSPYRPTGSTDDGLYDTSPSDESWREVARFCLDAIGGESAS